MSPQGRFFILSNHSDAERGPFPSAVLLEEIYAGRIGGATRLRDAATDEVRTVDEWGAVFPPRDDGAGRAGRGEGRFLQQLRTLALAVCLLVAAWFKGIPHLPPEIQDVFKSAGTRQAEAEAAAIDGLRLFEERWVRASYKDAVDLLRTLAADPYRLRQWRRATAPAASILLGLCTAEGLGGIPGDEPRGRDQIARLADDHPLVDALLGFAAETGAFDVATSDEVAFILYRDGAEDGSDVARLRMAACQARGIGTPRDIEAARPVLEAFAAEGARLARVVLEELPPEAAPGDDEATPAVAPTPPLTIEEGAGSPEDVEPRPLPVPRRRAPAEIPPLSGESGRAPAAPVQRERPDSPPHRLTREGARYAFFFRGDHRYHQCRYVVFEFLRPDNRQGVIARMSTYAATGGGRPYGEVIDVEALHGRIEEVTGIVTFSFGGGMTRRQALEMRVDAEGTGFDVTGLLATLRGDWEPAPLPAERASAHGG